MLIGVGVGREVEYALYSSIKNNNPNFVGFIVTKQSKGTLDRIIAEEGKGIRDIVHEHEIFLADNPEELNETFRVCENAVHSLLRKGYARSEIVVDITSGTKVMSATIATLAVLYRLYSVTYVGGKHGTEGIVIKGTEKPNSVKPVLILLAHDLNRIKDYFSIFQFEASKSVVDRLLNDSSFLEEQEKERILDAGKIIEGFNSWEHFDHKAALIHLKKVKTPGISVAQLKYLEDLRGEHNQVAAACSSQLRNPMGKVPTKYLIIGIFQNAKRRSQTGSYDDAIAKLYRCLEMIAQYLLLLKHGLQSSDIDLEKLKNKIPDTLFEQLSSRKKWKQKIEVGLIECFEILSNLDKEHTITAQYLNKKQILKECLIYRNNSILAHGTTPTNRDNYEKMEQVVKDFVQALIPDVDDKLKAKN